MSGPKPVLSIELFQCEACGSTTDELNFYRPLNTLEGCLTLTNATDLDLTSIEVSFLGVQKTTVVTNSSSCYIASTAGRRDLVTMKSTRNFLTIMDHPAVESGRRVDDRYTVQFYFSLPRQTADYTVPPQCPPLPPSIKIVQNSTDPATRNQSPAAAIEYFVRGSIRYFDNSGHSRGEDARTITVAKEINFLPYTTVQPRTDVASHPKEFATHITQPFRRHHVGGLLGSVSMAVLEPLPLTYMSASSLPSTDCVLKLKVNGPHHMARHLQTISLKLGLAIRAKTVYSVESIPCIPMLAYVNDTGTIRMHDRVFELGEQKHNDITWQFDTNIHTDRDPPSYEAVCHSRSQHRGSQAGTMVARKSRLRERLSGFLGAWSRNEKYNGTWHSAVNIPIKPLLLLPPNFCRELMARSYSILLQVDIIGAVTKRANFEVPLQVIYLEPRRSDEHLATVQESSYCLGVTRLLAQDRLDVPRRCCEPTETQFPEVPPTYEDAMCSDE